ncbi:unnamed protein product [Oncorhynchus mykiss]|uniref:Cadherin domain-containing protein n=1 Tax=Oncorhynchus mykiss TaxID=8022 RepID=A0A060VQJ0_ONCMY|nr:unnamed protein product [Oncorhynchus mykiss]
MVELHRDLELCATHIKKNMHFLCFRGTRGSAIRKWQLHLLIFSVCFSMSVNCQFRYSFHEEMTTGSFVGNIVQDLGLQVKRLKSSRARIFTEDNREYIGINVDKGTLVVKERRDKQELCAQVAPCSLHFRIIIENPIELLRIDVEILHINDNTTVFSNKDIRIEISEGSLSGARFPLENAMEPDVGINSIQTYSLLPMAVVRVRGLRVLSLPCGRAGPLLHPGGNDLGILCWRYSKRSGTGPATAHQDVGENALQKYMLNPTDHFNLNVQGSIDDRKHIEMVLQKPLDREKTKHHYLTLTAVDGGDPQRSGTVQIHIVVLDANDNAPAFSQATYKAFVPENAAKGTLITTVSATDADEGSSINIEYYFEHATKSIQELFTIDPISGEVKVVGDIDYEKNKQFQIKVKAKDHGGLTDSCSVVIDVIDINDNIPKITVMSFSSALPEDSVPGTIIAMINIQDLDSAENAEITCSIHNNLPFKMESSLSNYYNLVTESVLDREQTAEYNITITAVDGGSPPLSSKKTLSLKISDVNDHSPQFPQESYDAYVFENNVPSRSFFSVSATDADRGSNARVSYFLEDGSLNGAPLSAYLTVNSDSGVLYAVKPFDYEQIKSFKINVKAQDGGSPPLSGNVTINIFIKDENDNVPQVLYPVQTSGSLVAEMVPRSADVGYLVTKVVAVDVDSGQNAWLSYKLKKTTDRALFEIGLQNGEIRTIRQVTDKDAVKQKLTVVVEDNGQPSRSATVNVNVAVADSFPEVLSEFIDITVDREYDNNLTFYLVLALAVVSVLFIFSIIAIVTVKIYRWRQNRLFYKSAANLPVIPFYPPVYPDGTLGTLQRVYNYEVCGTTDSRMSNVKPYSQNTLVDVSCMGTMQRENREQEDADVDGEVRPPLIHSHTFTLFSCL